MVDNRQTLKNTVEADLKKKIQCAQKVLGDLHGAVRQVEDNSTKAKDEVNQAVQAIQQLIGKRKLELTRQIEIICHIQISSLQSEIQSIYLALGSLQSTLSNLDSFDHTQLLCLHIPNVSPTCNSVPAPVELKVNNVALDEDIKKWGSISSNGLKGLFDVGTSASLPPRFVEYQDGKSGQESFMSHKPVVEGGSSSVINFLRQPKLPCIAKQNNFEPMGFEMCDIERALYGVQLQQSSDCDDFEIVSFECSSPIIKRKDSAENEMLENNKYNCNNRSKSNVSSNIMAGWQNEVATNDLSKWLKPKKSTSGKENMSPSTKIEDKRDAYIHNPLKNRFVDFPCLRTDPKTWVPAKRAKLSASESPQNGNSMFPPEYSLPGQFWLKKYC